MFRGDRRIARMPWKVVKTGSVADGRDNSARDNSTRTLGVVPQIQRSMSSGQISPSPGMVSPGCPLRPGAFAPGGS